jgi:hypothetical protein
MTARPFNGIVDDVRVYTRPLSDDEVWELYAWKGREPVTAAIPEPAEEATGVMPSQKLSWTAAKGASEHLVYLGSDADKVAKATSSSSEFKGAVKITSFDPGKFDFGETYYWRDDELIPSLVKFATDGSPVLIIYQADRSEPLYPDCARAGREGARGILNAFELIQVEAK